MNKSKKNGFTLIELLVVISIIGLLSSIVFTSLGNARIKAKDAAIKANVKEMQKVIELDYFNGNYSNYFDTGLWVNGFVRKDCSNLTGDMAEEAQKICAAIYKIGVGDFEWGHNENEFKMGIREFTLDGVTFKSFRHDMYGITVRLNSGNYYCLSNIGVYEGPSPFADSHPCFFYLTP